MYDVDERKTSCISIETQSDEAYNMLSKQACINFKFGLTHSHDYDVKPLPDFIASVSSKPSLGFRYSLLFGPFPGRPTQETIHSVGYLLSKYGTITHTKFNKDHTMLIGFGLGKKNLPKERKPLPVMYGTKCVCTLKAPFQIKAYGVNACKACPGLGEHHAEGCTGIPDGIARNKAYSYVARAANNAKALGAVSQNGQLTTKSGELCNKFKIGKCNKGNKCRFVHGTNATPAAPPPAATAPASRIIFSSSTS